MSTHEKKTEGATATLSWAVGGMDCASCAAKIETALARMPGLSDISVNFSGERVTLRLAGNAATTPDEIEKKIRALGFDASRAPSPSTRPSSGHGHEHGPSCSHDHGAHEHGHHGHDHNHDHGHVHHDTLPVAGTGKLDAPEWWQSRKGKLVLGLSLLMGIAYGVAQFFPAYAIWIFGAAVVAGVIPFAQQAIVLAFSGSPFSIQMLMSVAALGALTIGAAEEAAAVVFLFAVGELLESVAATRARAGIKALSSLVPKTALVIDPSGASRSVPAEALRVGDIVLVRPGDRVPADGVVIEGSTSLDESPITGESIPRIRNKGDDVFAGSINADGAVRVRVTKVASDNTIARIIHLVEEAQASKAPTARFIERFSRVYTPAVMLVAGLVIAVPPLLAGAEWSVWFYRGLALLLIACPCALVLSTPAAIASGLAAGARRGLLIKGGHALEMIGTLKTIAFDKTGTLTIGRPTVTDIIAAASQTERDVIALAAAVESGSSHPLAKAILARAQADGITIPAAAQSSAVPGKAMKAVVEGRTLAVGSPLYAQSLSALSSELVESATTLEEAGKTVTVLLDTDRCAALGLIAMRDEPREDAHRSVVKLRDLGLRPIMLTGDNKRTAKAIAEKLDLDWQAELLPADKLRTIEGMRRDGKVAMVGDGINDAPALAAADVGIAMGGGTDVALETADAALLKNSMTDLVHLIHLSRATMRNIHQNIVIALGLKGLFLVTSVIGITGLWVAVLADTGATAIVTLNAIRLLRFRGER
ncbi:heavy metal translocating P-type ATPase [Microvirga flavescens]|uniref:heavy metal translocating P-type ATPase n=1 Tax=Microvirga flavescens TaxID=2249811 RepID=UPI00130031EA|nr:heavy metal translocating P-type ATPase [Microvirga flavescens]